VPEDDAFCESCGQKLGEPAAACVCGAGAEELDAEGFCLRCGRRVRRPASDHVEVVISPAFAGVSDRGLRHDRNEDRFAVAQVGAGSVMVVCDGVSATNKSERASEAVSVAVMQSLTGAVARAGVHTEAAMQEALAAGAAVLNNPYNAEPDPPSTTVVAALVLADVATVAWAGDSRAYWFDAAGMQQLTQDHSWLNDAVSGGLSAEAAELDPRAHAITRWFGADNAGTASAEVVRFPLPGKGVLMLCTDGLWNYAPTLEEMAAAFLTARRVGDDVLGWARDLIRFANEAGGRDNVTVALLRVDGG
jgi:serine/threonine protein phosphatase PrpC